MFVLTGINVELTSVKEPREFKHNYDVIDGNFRIGELSLHVVNSKVCDTANVSNLNCKLEEYIISEEAFLFVGDFSDISNHSGNFFTLWLLFKVQLFCNAQF